MKKITVILMSAMLCVSSFTAMAQDANKNQKQRPSKEEMIDQRCKHAVKELMLDDATAAKFTPIYKDYLNELQQGRPDRGERMGKDEKKAPKEFSESEVDNMMKERFSQERKRVDIQEKYYGEFRTVLNAKQASKLFKNEGRGGNGQHGNHQQGQMRHGGKKHNAQQQSNN